jgi:hypothetical protein
MLFFAAKFTCAVCVEAVWIGQQEQHSAQKFNGGWYR